MASRHEGKQPVGQSCSQALERFPNNVAVLPIVTHTQATVHFKRQNLSWETGAARRLGRLYTLVSQSIQWGACRTLAQGHRSVWRSLVSRAAPAAGAPLALPPAG